MLTQQIVLRFDLHFDMLSDVLVMLTQQIVLICISTCLSMLVMLTQQIVLHFELLIDLQVMLTQHIVLHFDLHFDLQGVYIIV